MHKVEPNPDHATAAPEIITMYGADWCGDCLRAKAFFEANDIEYNYVDMVEHESAVDIVLARNNGVQKIPVIVYPDNSHLVEPTNNELQAAHDTLATTSVDNAETDGYRVEENRDEGRFELHHDGEVLSIATFSERSGGVVVIPYVETNPAHRGQGNAGRLMTGVLETIRASGRTVVPRCPFAARFIAENPEYQDLIAAA